jgi:hypothetical protein
MLLNSSLPIYPKQRKHTRIGLTLCPTTTQSAWQRGRQMRFGELAVTSVVMNMTVSTNGRAAATTAAIVERHQRHR